MNQPNILIVEDEMAIADTIVYALGTDGMQTVHCTLGQAALDRLSESHFDLVVLDVGLPDMSGFEVCRRLRTFTDIPVIFLTARHDEIDRIVGLEIGADDYVVKPFSPRELAARVRVILRRFHRPAAPQPQPMPMPAPATAAGPVAPGFVLDTDGARVSWLGHALDLTRYEFGLLALLVRHPGRIYSREQLMDLVWHEAFDSADRTVDTHVKTLRAKLRAIDPERDPIRTHRGMGYSLQP
ncbi:two-component system response regulator CreB [Burkholderia stabilis]|uniref:two-component system response regulator CreB n=1 Tax=Burkholderia stabilis TaxID=95485 RepID=UPI000851C5D8|nr:two-component system response regulator CreB [Burkholderia stabilis]AOR70537.1 two-component system response regulator CreB [Burkholderia stabilis]HDR9494518.1 two-component system response regulator CreB [Burkholderia stabilis]HDR9524234.1 two-component system response regulator CreB [Burkholderia stabilis]HDR9532351.1 two-component system response regulator CreB [Burkholderia stabilis]HDR9541391.1 two-component system response regulator CreB [Burkholderia stabilis]